ncbi:prolyl oligopeptidase family serine peptidase [Prosthecochloris sp. CIB 2401]|uniref:prolyl oligopeptidase family serine peptidase n=1 Tax=Prosthecochloris sp. CIB 2401 TaxID=1868325 RepID=UPI00080A9919|nr:prolyl oligopeptidase family serine peptidase [Prosthecochloris sp. CIB 2401]ANT64537.1 Prolyl endopeptidase precursor [Prosthecochloris sp. CIB 2401]
MTMKHALTRFLVLCTATLSLREVQATDEKQEAMLPPATPVTETLCDTTITDPYRALEKLSDPDVDRWMRSEAARAREVLDGLPRREELLTKMREFDSRRKEQVYNLVISESNRYFYLKRQPGEEVGQLFWRDGFEGAETLLFDPREYAKESGADYVVSRVSPAHDGSKAAVAISADGSENSVLLVLDVETGKAFPEKIDRCRFASPSWLADNETFLYNRMRQGNLLDPKVQMDSRVLLHRVGTEPSEDRLVFSRSTHPDLQIRPEDIPGIAYDKDSGYLFGFVRNVDRRLQVYYAPAAELDNERISWTPLLEPEDNVHDFAVTDSELYLYTPEGAPNFRILQTSLFEPDLDHAVTVVDEDPDAVLTGFGVTSEGMYYTRSRNGVAAELYHAQLDGSDAKRLELPFPAGMIRLQDRGFRHPELWAVIGGWANDYRRYRYDAEKGEFVLETLSSPADYPEYENLVIRELMVRSHDGTKVPLSLIYREGLERDGRNPLLFYGYGAYGRSMSPFFNPSMLLWTHYGGILAVAHVRGGGELGDQWHLDGMKTTKENTWKDLISLAEWVTKKGYSSPEHIAATSASAGGILIGRAMTERPDLFAAMITQVGAMNPLRGEETPNGPVNVPEFGTVKDSLECRALIDMDPYLNLRKGVPYPATLVTAGINDPRVIAWQPAKFAARLQASTSSENPVLFQVDYQAGHGIGNTRTRQFESLADLLTFALWQTR